MKTIQAMSQAEVAIERSRLEKEYAATVKQIADLQARQARVERTLSRVSVQTALLGKRAVPQYSPWLPFSSNGNS